jgi:hypothetical protein
MTLRMSRIADPGSYDRERIILLADGQTDIGNNAVFRTTIADDQITSDVKNVFWFPNRIIEAGDLVILYSKSGTEREKRNPTRGNKSHFFYWNLGEPCWHTGVYGAVLIEMALWAPITP